MQFLLIVDVVMLRMGVFKEEPNFNYENYNLIETGVKFVEFQF